jgi:type III secretion system-like peptide-binding chaperone
MERDLRLLVYEKELRRLLFELRDHDYVIFEDSQDGDRYVQYMVHHSAVLGEVGSRQWLPEAEGLRQVSVTALGCLGFEGGELRRNFSRDHLPHDPRRLACLTELLFGAAYGGVGEITPLVRTRASREAECPPPAIEFDA